MTAPYAMLNIRVEHVHDGKTYAKEGVQATHAETVDDQCRGALSLPVASFFW